MEKDTLYVNGPLHGGTRMRCGDPKMRTLTQHTDGVKTVHVYKPHTVKTWNGNTTVMVHTYVLQEPAPDDQRSIDAMREIREAGIDTAGMELVWQAGTKGSQG